MYIDFINNMKYLIPMILVISLTLGMNVHAEDDLGLKRIENSFNGCEVLRNVTKVEFMYIDHESVFRSAVTPELLEKIYDCRLSLCNLRSWSKREMLCSHLSQVVERSNDKNLDIRYGISVYDSDNVKVLGLYIDDDSEDGILNGRRVKVGPTFKKWLQGLAPIF